MAKYLTPEPKLQITEAAPALIFGRKHQKLVLPAPDGYGVGGDSNYYFLAHA